MKNSRKKMAIAIILMAIVIITIIGGTFAFFLVSPGNNKNEVVTVKSGTMVLTFTDNSDGIEKNDLKFEDTIEKELKIENTGTLDAYAKISWDNLTNTFLEGSLTYSLVYKTSETGDWQNVKIKNRKVPTSTNPNKYEIVDRLLIPTGTSYIYKITITYNDLDVDQTQDLNATFSTKFTLEEGKSTPLSVMMARESATSTEKIWGHSTDVKRIVFENELEPKLNATYTYDISAEQNESVMSYLIPDSEDNTKYVLYIQGDGEIIANENSSNLFRNFTNLENIQNLDYLDTSYVTNMAAMFFNCNNLVVLGVNDFDTSNVTDMGSMFSGCGSLITLDVSNFYTSNVTNMNAMFNNCSSLTTLDLSNFDTSNVTQMRYMFQKCNSLTTLDISIFDTSNVIDIQGMFINCSSLATLNLSNFDVSSVTSSTSIFNSVPSTIEITVSNSTMRQWVIEASDNPKLTTSNVIIG